LRKLECECGNKTFFIDKNRAIAKCSKCFKKYDYNGEQWIKSPSALKKLIGFFFKRIKPKKIEPYKAPEPETIGEFRKRIGVKKEKKKKKPVKKKIELVKPKPSKEKWFLYAKWFDLIYRLKKQGVIEFKNNDHYGDLRGKDIVRIAHRDLNKLGIKTKTSFYGSGGKLYLKDKFK